MHAEYAERGKPDVILVSVLIFLFHGEKIIKNH